MAVITFSSLLVRSIRMKHLLRESLCRMEFIQVAPMLGYRGVHSWHYLLFLIGPLYSHEALVEGEVVPDGIHPGGTNAGLSTSKQIN
jgi:hypothetical protein